MRLSLRVASFVVCCDRGAVGNRGVGDKLHWVRLVRDFNAFWLSNRRAPTAAHDRSQFARPMRRCRDGQPITTVRDFQEVGYTLSPRCSHHFICSHYRTPPIEYLAAHLGLDLDLYANRRAILRRLTCSKCGGNYPQLQIATQQNRKLNAASGAAHAHGEATPSRRRCAIARDARRIAGAWRGVGAG
jgi:hypothetical protein